jgi:hypothetical protein
MPFPRAEARRIIAAVLAELDESARIAMLRDALDAQERGEDIAAWAERAVLSAFASPGPEAKD